MKALPGTVEVRMHVQSGEQEQLITQGYARLLSLAKV